jgi:adenine-specific DNA-methyltransferase
MATEERGMPDTLIENPILNSPYREPARHPYGRLTALPARMNPDLLIGDTLKNTGAGNLFMVFGEPEGPAISQGPEKAKWDRRD